MSNYLPIPDPMSHICPNCGVELEAAMHACPLCNFTDFDNPSQQGEMISASASLPKSRTISEYEKLSPVQKRKLFWELSGIALISVIVVTLIINLVSSNGITWSRYPMTACLVLFVNITLFSFLRHRLLYLLGGSFLSTSALLVLFDLFNNAIGWGTHLGIPILFSVYLISFFITMMLNHSKHKGFNILAWFFLSTGLLSLCIDGILSDYLKDRINFHWSLIVMVCIIPVSGILFYIHYRLKKGIELRQFFHI
jgi:hypothetical protein